MPAFQPARSHRKVNKKLQSLLHMNKQLTSQRGSNNSQPMIEPKTWLRFKWLPALQRSPSPSSDTAWRPMPVHLRQATSPKRTSVTIHIARGSLACGRPWTPAVRQANYPIRRGRMPTCQCNSKMGGRAKTRPRRPPKLRSDRRVPTTRPFPPASRSSSMKSNCKAMEQSESQVSSPEKATLQTNS